MKITNFVVRWMVGTILLVILFLLTAIIYSVLVLMFNPEGGSVLVWFIEWLDAGVPNA